MFKYIDLLCPECGVVAQSVDVPSGESFKDAYECDICGEMGQRKISFTIAKIQIEEKVHGGEFQDGKYVTKYDDKPLKRTREQLELKKKLTAERKKGNNEAAAEVARELVSKRAEAIKDVTK